MAKGVTVPKPKKPGNPKDASRQVAFRAAMDLAKRLDATAAQLGLDTSNLIRMILTEKLPEYEARARRSQEQPDA